MSDMSMIQVLRIAKAVEYKAQWKLFRRERHMYVTFLAFLGTPLLAYGNMFLKLYSKACRIPSKTVKCLVRGKRYSH